MVAATVATFTAPATTLTVTVPTLTATSWNVCAYTGATTQARQPR